jgi:hypothetical protein
MWRSLKAAKDTIVLSVARKFSKAYIENDFIGQLLDCYRPDYPKVASIQLIVDVAGVREKASTGVGRVKSRSLMVPDRLDRPARISAKFQELFLLGRGEGVALAATNLPTPTTTEWN